MKEKKHENISCNIRWWGTAWLLKNSWGTAFIVGALVRALIIWLHTFHCSKTGMILMRI